jgi:predicted lipoprotein with Yx(FWY)xxD motif
MAHLRIVAALTAVLAAGLGGCSSHHGGGMDHMDHSMMPANYTASGNYMHSSAAGAILTTPEGRTVYTFDKDSPGVSSCYGGCAEEWPPVTASADAQPFGHMSVVARTDGTHQWAYDGKPLYLYHDDAAPGDMEGDGEGGVWHVVK